MCEMCLAGTQRLWTVPGGREEADVEMGVLPRAADVVVAGVATYQVDGVLKKAATLWICNSNGGGCDEKVLIAETDASTSDLSAVALAEDGNGRAMGAMFVDGDMCLFHCTDEACTEPTGAACFAFTGSSAPVAWAGPDGLLRVAYADSGLRIVACTAVGCTSITERTVATQNIRAVGATIDGEGVPVFTMIGGSTRCPSAQDAVFIGRCADAECATANMTVTMVGQGLLPSCSSAALGVRPAVGTDPLRLAAYNGTLAEVLVFNCSGTTCASFTAAPVAVPGASVSTPLVPNGASPVVIGDSDADRAFSLSRCNNLACTDGDTESTISYSQTGLSFNFAVAQSPASAEQPYTYVSFSTFDSSQTYVNLHATTVGGSSSAGAALPSSPLVLLLLFLLSVLFLSPTGH